MYHIFYREIGRVVIRSLSIVLLSIFIASYSSSIMAKGSKKAGSKKARACQICHGKGGQSTNPTYPVLAGQHAQYIVKQLKAFKAGTRKDPIMNGMASTLNVQDMEDVAAFFESSRKK
ncbi:MAG: cytochrome c [Thiohalomonadales bacterium]